jgi:hypothetical protein
MDIRYHYPLEYIILQESYQVLLSAETICKSKYFNLNINLNTFSMLKIPILTTKKSQTVLSTRKAYRKRPIKLRGKNTIKRG